MMLVKLMGWEDLVEETVESELGEDRGEGIMWLVTTDKDGEWLFAMAQEMLDWIDARSLSKFSCRYINVFGRVRNKE